MAAMELFSNLLPINHREFTTKELNLLEVRLLLELIEQIQNAFMEHYKDYFSLIHYKKDLKEMMLQENFIKTLVCDILATQEYTLAGIALYTHFPEEIIYELAVGQNKNPSFHLSMKIMQLHSMVRPGLYKELINKVIESFLQKSTNYL